MNSFFNSTYSVVRGSDRNLSSVGVTPLTPYYEEVIATSAALELLH